MLGNSILQILFSIVDFRKLIIQKNSTSSCECSNDEFCVFCIVENTVRDMMIQENEYIDLSELAYNAKSLSDYFIVGGFNDAAELFEILIDKYSEFTNDHIRFHIASVLKNFKIEIEDQFQCFNCGKDIHMNYPTYEINYLNLDTTRHDHETIDDCLKTWSQWELLENYECKLCYNRQGILKRSNVLQMNKFCVFYLNKSSTSKISYPIEFIWTQQNKKLRLFAVGCGKPQDHWWAYTYVKDNWWKCDDLLITKTHEDKVVNHVNAIMLFYETMPE